MSSAPNEIWIVERQRDEDYGAAKHVVSWHPSLVEAQAMAARLQTEFNEARDRSMPWHVDIEAIFDMLEEHEHAKYLWIDCDREECGYFEREHTHMTERELEEHEAAFIEQLSSWWHEQRNAWQDFAENEVMAKMTDPPTFCLHLVRDEEVRYVCYAVGRDPAVIRKLASTAPEAP